MEQREIDNMLLSMIQKHFPSLPLSDEYTDWGKWLGFARAAYEAGRASPASVPGWKLVPDVPTSTMVLAGEKALSEHDFLRMDSAYCAMLASAPTPPVSEDRKDAERYHKLANYMIGTRFDIDDALVAASSIDEISSILDAMQEDKP